VTVDAVPRLGVDVLRPDDLRAAAGCGGAIRPVAFASMQPAAAGAWVGPAFVGAAHPLADVTGVENTLRLSGASGRTVTFTGPGAGPDATAATILDDVVELTSGLGSGVSYERAGAPVAAGDLSSPPPGRWFVVVDGRATILPPGPWSEAQQWAADHASGQRVLVLPVVD
jgi:hypothetical protein